MREYIKKCRDCESYREICWVIPSRRHSGRGRHLLRLFIMNGKLILQDSLPWEQVGTALRVYFLVAKKAAMESSPFQGSEQMEPTGNS